MLPANNPSNQSPKPGQQGAVVKSAPALAPSAVSLKKIFIGIIFIILLLFGGAVYWVYFSTAKHPSQKINSTENQQAQLKAQMDIQAGALMAVAKLEFPRQGFKFSPAAEKDIPQDVKVFVLDKAANLQYQAVNYSGSQKGFYITYDMEEAKLQEAWLKMQTTVSAAGKWQPVNSQAAGLFALLEYQKPDSSAQVKASLLQFENKVQVKIQTLSSVK
jgi:hypothetical protein